MEYGYTHTHTHTHTHNLDRVADGVWRGHQMCLRLSGTLKQHVSNTLATY